MRGRLRVIMLILTVIMVPWVVFAEEQPQEEVLTLDKCLELAYKNSKQLKSAEKSVEIAKEALRQAEAGLLPTVGYQVGAQKLEKSTPPLVPTTEGSSGSISMSQNLYTGGVITCGIKIAKLGLAKALEDQRKVKQTLTFNVKSAYYQTWLTQQLVRVAQAAYDNLGNHVQQMKNFYQVGTKSKFDLLQAQVQHDGLKPPLIKAQNGLIIAKLSLATIIGIDKERQFVVSDDSVKVQLPEKVEYSLQELLNQVYRDRPEMRQLGILNEINNLQTKLAFAGYKPKVNITGAYSGKSADYDPSNWNPTWTLTLGITGNFFDGFKTPAAVAQAKKTEEKALIDESYQRDNIRLEVQQSIQDIKGNLESSRASQSSIELAKESLRLTQARFNAGMATTMDIMDAELALDKASNDYYSSLSSYLTALAKLDLVMGKDS